MMMNLWYILWIFVKFSENVSRHLQQVCKIASQFDKSRWYPRIICAKFQANIVKIFVDLFKNSAHVVLRTVNFMYKCEFYVQYTNPCTQSNSATEDIQNMFRGVSHLHVNFSFLVPCILSVFWWCVGLIVGVWREWLGHKVIIVLTIFFFSFFQVAPQWQKEKRRESKRVRKNKK